jgi:hypothetical protein
MPYGGRANRGMQRTHSFLSRSSAQCFWPPRYGASSHRSGLWWLHSWHTAFSISATELSYPTPACRVRLLACSQSSIRAERTRPREAAADAYFVRQYVQHRQSRKETACGSL